MQLAYDYAEYLTAGDAEYDELVRWETRAVVEGDDIDGLIGTAARSLSTLTARSSVLSDRVVAAMQLAGCAAAPVVDPAVAAELDAWSPPLSDTQQRVRNTYREMTRLSPASLGEALATLRRLDTSQGPAGLGEAHAFAPMFLGAEDDSVFVLRDVFWLGAEYASQFALDFEALLMQAVADLQVTKLGEHVASSLEALVEGPAHERPRAAARLGAAIALDEQPRATGRRGSCQNTRRLLATGQACSVSAPVNLISDPAFGFGTMS